MCIARTFFFFFNSILHVIVEKGSGTHWMQVLLDLRVQYICHVIVLMLIIHRLGINCIASTALTRGSSCDSLVSRDINTGNSHGMIITCKPHGIWIWLARQNSETSPKSVRCKPVWDPFQMGSEDETRLHTLLIYLLNYRQFEVLI